MFTQLGERLHEPSPLEAETMNIKRNLWFWIVAISLTTVLSGAILECDFDGDSDCEFFCDDD